MLRSISLKAVLLAPVLGFVIPFGVIGFGLAPLLIHVGEDKAWAGTVLLWFWVLLTTAGPLATGYVGARLAVGAPVLHGLAAGGVGFAVALLVFSYQNILAAAISASGVSLTTSIGLATPTMLTAFLVLSLFGAVMAKRSRAKPSRPV